MPARIGRWSQSAIYNLPLFHKISGMDPLRLKNLLHPIQYRDRKDLWILAAGLLDTARYLNVPADGPDLHEHFDGNFRERNVWGELRGYIEYNHEAEFRAFRKRWSVETNNFKKVKDFKTKLYVNIFKDEKFQDEWNPLTLLEHAVERQQQSFGNTADKPFNVVNPQGNQ